MAETTADVKRDIEMTRERISTTLAQLEQKTNVLQIIKDHPWPAIGVALGAGVLLAGSNADVKAAGATVVATRGASSKLGTVLDDLVSQLMTGLHGAFQHKVDSLVEELKVAIGAPIAAGGNSSGGNSSGGYSSGGSRGAQSSGSAGGFGAGSATTNHSASATAGQAQQFASGAGQISQAGSQGTPRAD